MLNNPTHFPVPLVCRIRQVLTSCTHFPVPVVCQIRQVLTSCTLRHISLFPWCVGLDRFWHPVTIKCGFILWEWQSSVRVYFVRMTVNRVRVYSVRMSVKCQGLFCENDSQVSGFILWEWQSSVRVYSVRMTVNRVRVYSVRMSVKCQGLFCENDNQVSRFILPWCVRLDRFWHPVHSDTFPCSLGVLD
jgi:hypothetical protein